MRRLSIAVLLLALPLLSMAGPDSPVDEFTAGLALFDESLHEFALEKFTVARPGLKPIDDYVLLYIARAHLAMGNTDASIAAARELVETYPASPLVPKARALELKNHLMGDWSTLEPELASYIEEFPAQQGMRLLYGSLLKEHGRIDEAVPVLKALYIEAGDLEQEALSVLGHIPLSNEELLERATNLNKARRYAEAEAILRPLYRSVKELRPEATEQLALALFRQRKYPEAARLHTEADDLHNAARAFIRSGRMNDFYLTLDTMITRRDAQGGVLLVAFANEVRRDGNLPDALALLDEALSKFPLVREDALWSKGWFLYASHRYEEALPVFESLATEYETNKYLYWTARTREHLESAAIGPPRAPLTLKGSDFYTVMAGTKNGFANTPGLLPSPEQTPSVPLERADLLIQAGLTREAASELMHQAKRATTNEELLALAQKLHAIEEHRSAISIMTRVPEDLRPRRILYPLAFWPTVEETASRYDIDPYLVLSLIREESRFDPQAVSAVGAIGLMQLMPETAKREARRLKLPIDGPRSIHEVGNNITLGTHHLDGLLREFENVPMALAAYNAGRTRVKRWLRDGDYASIDEFIEDIPYPETRNYVKRIVTSYFQYQATFGEGPVKVAGIL